MADHLTAVGGGNSRQTASMMEENAEGFDGNPVNFVLERIQLPSIIFHVKYIHFQA